MRDPWGWNEDDILALIKEGEQESLTLDYKALDALEKTDGKKNEISKDVSSFANSAGGIIVYGVGEDANRLPLPITDGYDPAVVTREWLDQVITSRIQRRIDGLRINQVSLDKTAPGKVIYVVSIPQSFRAPHMAWDKRYYKRYEFHAQPMEEYEVRDVSRRADTPDLSVVLSLPEAGRVALQAVSAGASHYQPISVLTTVTNASSAPASSAVIRLYLDRRLGPEGPFHEGVSFTLGEFLSRPVAVLRRPYGGISGDVPIWQDEDFPLLHPPLRLTVPCGEARYLIAWKVTCAAMPPKSGIHSLVVSGDEIRGRAELITIAPP